MRCKANGLALGATRRERVVFDGEPSPQPRAVCANSDEPVRHKMLMPWAIWRWQVRRYWTLTVIARGP